jgi:hypothetical protein
MQNYTSYHPIKHLACSKISAGIIVSVTLYKKASKEEEVGIQPSYRHHLLMLGCHEGYALQCIALRQH